MPFKVTTTEKRNRLRLGQASGMEPSEDGTGNWSAWEKPLEKCQLPGAGDSPSAVPAGEGEVGLTG